MIVQKFIQKELSLINPMYFAIYNPCIEEGKSMSCGRARWQVRKWKGIFPKKPYLWREFSENILTICREEMTDEGLIDAGYMEIDMRTIDAIRASHWWKIQWKKKIAEMDARNDMREQKVDEQLDYESRAVAKSVWRHRHEPQVIQSGKWDYYKE